MRKLILKTLAQAFVFLIFVCQLAAQIPTNGLVAYYPFTGNSDDSSGNGNHGVVYGATLSTDRFGHPNSAYYFNGTNNYIKVTNSLLNLANYSYSIWVKYEPVSADSAGYYILGIGTIPHVKYGTCLGISTPSGYTLKPGVTVTSGNTDDTYVGFSTDSLPQPNVWYHLVLTRSDSAVKMYIDNQLKGVRPTENKSPFYANPLNMFIGTRSELFNFFKGSLDDITVYDHALSDMEIAQLFTKSINSQLISDITGMPEVCAGKSSINYSILPVNGATSYLWSYDGSGASINGSSNAISIDFSANATSGILKVFVTLPDSSIQSSQMLISVNNCSSFPITGLDAYYPFNGNANDESGNGQNGTVNSALLTTDRFGTANAAYYFDGASYITIQNPFDYLPRTIDLWFNTVDSNYNIYGSIYQSDNPDLLNGSTGIVVKSINGAAKLLMTINAVTDTIDINANVWYNVAVVTDSNKSISYYLNGKLKLTKQFIFIANSSSGNNSTMIGTNRLGNGQFFHGKIDDIRIYNRALSAPEISTLQEYSSIIDNINGPNEVCQGSQNIFYHVNHVAGANYSWYYTGSGASLNYVADTVLINFAAYATSGVLKVTVSVGNDSISQTREFPVTVNSCSASTPGLVAYYPFNGNANDESGNAINGTVYGATLTSDRFGNPNSAYFFDGYSSYIKVTNNKINTNNFTYSTWFKRKEIPSYSAGFYIIGIGAIPYQKYGMALGISKSGYSANSGCTVTSGNTDATYVGFTSDSLPEVDKWYNLVVTRNDSVVKMYINNQLKGIKTTDGKIPFYSNPVDVFIGTRCEFLNYFYGSIDDIAIYSRALDENEIRSLYYSNPYDHILSDIIGSKIAYTCPEGSVYKVHPLDGAIYNWSYTGTGATIIGSSDSISIFFSDSATSGVLKVTSIGQDTISQSKEISITVRTCRQGLANGLVAYYPLNGNANDESGNGYNGTVYGATLTNDMNGKNDSAYYFNGYNAYINIPVTELVNNQYSFSLWASASSIPYSGSGLMLLSIGSASGDQFICQDNHYSIYNGLGCGGYNKNEKQFAILNGITPTLNQWYHIVSTRDGNKIKLYINGVYLGSDSTASISIPSYGTGQPAARIGARFDYTIPFNGKIDDVRLYNRALSDSEVLSLYHMNYGLQKLSDIVGPDLICIGQQNVAYKIKSLYGASYSWSYTGSGATILGNSDSVLVNFGPNATSGSLKVTVSGSNILTQTKELPVTMNNCHITLYDTVHVFVYDTIKISVTYTLYIDAVLTGQNPPYNHNLMKAYPNPTMDRIVIDNGDYSRMPGYKLRIVNSLGTSVFESFITNQKFDIDLDSFGGKGTYFLVILDNSLNTIEVKKIVLL